MTKLARCVEVGLRRANILSYSSAGRPRGRVAAVLAYDGLVSEASSTWATGERELHATTAPRD